MTYAIHKDFFAKYTYIVYFDRMIHHFVATSYCRHVDKNHAQRYITALEKKGKFFNIRMEKL